MFGKAVAGLAFQDGGADVAAFQLKAKAVDPKLALPWIALPTTSGTVLRAPIMLLWSSEKRNGASGLYPLHP